MQVSVDLLITSIKPISTDQNNLSSATGEWLGSTQFNVNYLPSSLFAMNHLRIQCLGKLIIDS